MKSILWIYTTILHPGMENKYTTYTIHQHQLKLYKEFYFEII